MSAGRLGWRSRPLARELAPRDAKLIQQLELAPELSARDLAAKQLAVLFNGLCDLAGSLVQELQPKMAHAELQHPGDILRAGLGESVEHGVAAPDIGFDRMLGADPVPQLHIMPVTRPSTVGVVGALGKKRAEEAMLHVKHGHVLV